MLPCENQAAKTGRPRPGARGDLLGAIETIISALVDMAAGNSAASENSANHGGRSQSLRYAQIDSLADRWRREKLKLKYF